MILGWSNLSPNFTLRSIWHPERMPKVFITNRDKALRNVIATVFPDAASHLCVWHIKKNIETNCKQAFGDNIKAWAKFVGLWDSVVGSKSEDQYTERWNLLYKYLEGCSGVLDYLQKTCSFLATCSWTLGSQNAHILGAGPLLVRNPVKHLSSTTFGRSRAIWQLCLNTSPPQWTDRWMWSTS